MIVVILAIVIIGDGYYISLHAALLFYDPHSNVGLLVLGIMDNLI